MTKRALWAMLSLLAGAGCGGSSGQTSTVSNVPTPPAGTTAGGATTATDGGVARPGPQPVGTGDDGGVASDGGVAPDGGLATDGGIAPDAGAGSDGGVVTSGADGGSAPPDLAPPVGPSPPTWHAETSGVSGDLRGVYASGHDAWVVGPAGTLLHSRGDGSWSAIATGDGHDLTAVWGQGANDVFVTDAAGATLHATDGATFTAVGSTAPTPTALFGGGDVIYVNTVSAQQRPVLYRSLDHGATFAPLPVAASGFNSSLAVYDTAMWGDATSLFGANCIVQTNCQAYHSEDGGQSWALYPMPSGGGSVHTLFPSSFAVGDNFYVLYQVTPSINNEDTPNQSSFMVSTDRGKTFASSGARVAEPVDTFWVAASGDIVAVGRAGLVAQGNAKTLALTKVPTTANLNAVWGTSASDVYVVGDGGVILHFRP